MISQFFSRLTGIGQIAAMVTFGAAALVGVVATGLSLAGILPWPEIAISYDGAVVPWAGMALQIGVTALFVLTAVFMPSARRVLRLENSHRKFAIDMDDVTRAYRAAHMADRAETFEVRREFDAVRERYTFLKAQPDLAEMDAELLTIAAQMSEQSRELAEVYSDAKISRVRDALVQRHADAKALDARIQQSYGDLRDLKRLMEDVGAEESSVTAQLQRLRDEMAQIGVLDGPEFVANRKGPPHLKTVPAE